MYERPKVFIYFDIWWLIKFNGKKANGQFCKRDKTSRFFLKNCLKFMIFSKLPCTSATTLPRFLQLWSAPYLTPAKTKYRCYHPHRSRDSLSPVSRIFYSFLVFTKKDMLTWNMNIHHQEIDKVKTEASQADNLKTESEKMVRIMRHQHYQYHHHY